MSTATLIAKPRDKELRAALCPFVIARRVSAFAHYRTISSTTRQPAVCQFAPVLRRRYRRFSLACPLGLSARSNRLIEYTLEPPASFGARAGSLIATIHMGARGQSANEPAAGIDMTCAQRPDGRNAFVSRTPIFFMIASRLANTESSAAAKSSATGSTTPDRIGRGSTRSCVP